MIELDRVRKSFDGGATFAVAETSLTVPRGAFHVVVGTSGSGKTTLLKMINRLIEPDGGEVRVGGEAATALPAHELRRRIGYVFQGVGLFPHMSVGENVGITPRLLGWDRGRVAARVRELFELVGLPAGFASRAPAGLSGGQRQRVGLARALAAEPEVVLLDEPFGALDAVTRDEIGRAYRDLHDRLGLTTVMITHDVLEAVLLADRIGVMRGGRLLGEGAPAEMMGAHPDDYVRTLMQTPRRQAEAVAALLEGAG